MKTLSMIAAAVVAATTVAAPAHAQLPIQLSFNAGLARPVGNDADVLDNGFHAGAGLKLILIPVQLDASIDRMSAIGAGEDLTVLSAALTLPVSITPPLFPVAIYGLAGGGMYNQRAGVKSTDMGATVGVGARLNIPFLKPFAEARGIAVFGDERLTYITLAAGIRF